MSLFEGILLGVLQGLTEFLPVSSSGHLVIGQQLLGIKIPGNTFEVVVHVGTLFSVLVVFKNDIIQILTTIKEEETIKYITTVFIGTIPAVLVGLLFKHQIESAFDNILLVSIALLVTGSVLLSTRWITGGKNNIDLKKGLLIGIAQAFAIIPGISRSGSTISVALFLGLNPKKAAKFSFLLAIPALTGAGLIKSIDMLNAAEPTIGISLIIGGFISSFIVGWVSLKWLISMLSSGRFYWFGVYCLTIGSITLAYSW